MERTTFFSTEGNMWKYWFANPANGADLPEERGDLIKNGLK